MEAAGPDREPIIRHYQARLDWADRKALLRSIAPARIIAALCIVLWLMSLYELVREWAPSLAFNSNWSVFTAAMFPLAIAYVIVGVISVYANWLGWKYADALRQAAGGSSRNLTYWTRLHYAMFWWVAVGLVLSTLLDWIMRLVWYLFETSSH
jgi:hypothetical protein